MEKQLLDFINVRILNEVVSIDADAELLISGVLDSMNVMRLVDFIGDEFGLEIAPQDITIEHFSSVSQLTRFLGTQMAGTDE